MELRGVNLAEKFSYVICERPPWETNFIMAMEVQYYIETNKQTYGVQYRLVTLNRPWPKSTVISEILNLNEAQAYIIKLSPTCRYCELEDETAEHHLSGTSTPNQSDCGWTDMKMRMKKHLQLV